MSRKRSKPLVVAFGTGKKESINLKENQAVIIGCGDLCDLQFSGDGVSEKHCVVSYGAGAVWVRTLAEAFIGETLLSPDKSFSWKVGQNLNLGSVQLELIETLPLRQKLGQWLAAKLCRKQGVMLVALLVILIVLGINGYSFNRGGADRDYASPVSTHPVLVPRPIAGAAQQKIADSVADIFRLSGHRVGVVSVAEGVVSVKGSTFKSGELKEIVYSEAMRRISGLRQVQVERAKGEDFPNPLSGLIDHLVDGQDQYLVAHDGSRFYVGSRMPGGEMLVDISPDMVFFTDHGKKVNISTDGLLVKASHRFFEPLEVSCGFSMPCKERIKFAPYIEQAADTYQISGALIRAVIQAESAFNVSAISSAGALGLMQLMPETATEMGVDDPLDPIQNILGGSKYLALLLSRYDNDTTLALAAYNAGIGAVGRYGGVPPYPETQAYVVKVQRLMQGYETL